MNFKPWLKKEHKDIPDYFGLKIHLITGKTIELDKVAETQYAQNGRVYLVWTVDDLCKQFPTSSIEYLELDKNFSKLIEAKKKQDSGNK